MLYTCTHPPAKLQLKFRIVLKLWSISAPNIWHKPTMRHTSIIHPLRHVHATIPSFDGLMSAGVLLCGSEQSLKSVLSILFFTSVYPIRIHIYSFADLGNLCCEAALHTHTPRYTSCYFPPGTSKGTVFSRGTNFKSVPCVVLQSGCTGRSTLKYSFMNGTSIWRRHLADVARDCAHLPYSIKLTRNAAIRIAELQTFHFEASTQGTTQQQHAQML